MRLNINSLLRARGIGFIRTIGALLSGLLPQLRQYVQSKLQATATLYPLGFLATTNHLQSIDDFWSAAKSGQLPAVSIVDPDFGSCSEENPQDIQAGEGFAAKVINAVMQGKGWPDTLLIWLYDEHGGYYDHVPPPSAPQPDGVRGENPMNRFPLSRLLRLTVYGKEIEAADSGPSAYDRLGFRVPAVVVSPYAKANYVSSQIYDHTAILRLIERKWNLPSLTKRDAAASDFADDVLDLDNRPQFLQPPTLAAPAQPWRG